MCTEFLHCKHAKNVRFVLDKLHMYFFSLIYYKKCKLYNFIIRRRRFTSILTNDFCIPLTCMKEKVEIKRNVFIFRRVTFRASQVSRSIKTHKQCYLIQKTKKSIKCIKLLVKHIQTVCVCEIEPR